MEKLSLKRIDDKLPMPAYATKGSVAFDLYSRVNIKLEPWQVSLIPLNVIVKVPKGLALLVVPRSSSPRKKSLLIPHGVGIIDQDYCGPEDELILQVINFSKETVSIEKGERIAQGFLVKVAKVSKFEEMDVVTAKSRGGFGSTGTYA